MNQLIIIGNGFDLAHNFKTSYKDFLANYIFGIIYLNFYENKKRFFEDDLISIQFGNEYIFRIDDFVSKIRDVIIKYKDGVYDSIDLLSSINKLNSQFKFIKHKSTFSEVLLSSENNYWCDLEALYYEQLLLCLSSKDVNQVRKLNNQMNFLRDELVKYIANETNKEVNINNSIALILRNINSKRGKFESERYADDALFLNFNYSDTLHKYDNRTQETRNINYIHGSVNNDYGPVILGYGDESESEFEIMEKSSDSRDYMKFIKSFWYYQSDNYSNLFNFLEKGFEVNIIGHSCGKSDKTILSAIFNHKNCEKITIYPYVNESNISDLHEKVLNISKHFPTNAKHNMRMKIKYDLNYTIKANQKTEIKR